MKKIAVALEYNEDLPVVISSARGYLAEKLLEIAEKHNITVYKDNDLAEILSRLDAGTEIPENLFMAVAEVLAYCYKVNSSFREKLAPDFIQ
jgi:flagellar biosynthesis protein